MSNKRMPALFIGHGSPMNAIENNIYTQGWKQIASLFDKPKAILVVSAHWVTQGTRINATIKQKQIFDMFGFPEELYKLVYNVSGSPDLAHETIKHIKREVIVDNSWGMDHGAWSVLSKMYPNGDIPVFQLSIDNKASAESHFQIGREISSLRDEGVLILGSGNVVHNLSRINWDMDGGYPWAEEFDNYIKTNIIDKKYANVLNYKSVGKASDLAFFTTEHFYPLLYVLGASYEDDSLSIFNQSCLMGSMSMTCYLFD